MMLAKPPREVHGFESNTYRIGRHQMNRNLSSSSVIVAGGERNRNWRLAFGKRLESGTSKPGGLLCSVPAG